MQSRVTIQLCNYFNWIQSKLVHINHLKNKIKRKESGQLLQHFKKIALHTKKTCPFILRRKKAATNTKRISPKVTVKLQEANAKVPRVCSVRCGISKNESKESERKKGVWADYRPWCKLARFAYGYIVLVYSQVHPIVSIRRTLHGRSWVITKWWCPMT